ncbi:hypothetical protein DES39_2167 [Orbus hercynius]|uniref:DUF4123 domain-containing protein n=1 Tax=Orbus hercynius TaxID=593135 RepID=A0A495RBP3_9GAMM|nr:hypothetical protein [Orbus hercynius]RKS84428.1 hypothetical protein DES39_2167 [Orbus hercynius]
MSTHQLLNALLKGQATCYRYLLVDPLKSVRLDEPLALANINDVFPNDELNAILRPDLSYEPTLCPHLILLAKPGEDVESELLDFMLARIKKERSHYKHYICAWISSELDIQNLAQKIIELGLQLGRLMSPEKPSFLPFYEHIRLQLLKESLSAESLLSGLFNFIHRYIYINYYGQLIEINAANNSPTDDFLLFSQIFLQNALQYQNEPKATFGLVKMWQDNTPTLPANALFLSAKKLLEAKNIGLTNLEDRLVYALYCLIYQVDLINIETISPYISAAILAPGSLKKGLEQLDKDIWANLHQNNN